MEHRMHTILTGNTCMFPDIINIRKMGTQNCKVEATLVIKLRIRWAGDTEKMKKNEKFKKFTQKT